MDAAAWSPVVAGEAQLGRTTLLNEIVFLVDCDNTLLDTDRLYEGALAALAHLRRLGRRLTTVFARQGHYALDPANIAAYPAAAWSIDHIRDLVSDEFIAFLGNRQAECAQKEPR